MKLHRCAVLFLELDEHPRFELATLFAGGDGVQRAPRWLAHAPTLSAPLSLSPSQLRLLQAVPRDGGCDVDALQGEHALTDIELLREAGLLLAADDNHSDAALRDAAAREISWWPPALLAQHGGAWEGIDIEARYEARLMPNMQEMVDAHGQPPGHEYRRHPQQPTQPLPLPTLGEFDALLAQRATCRNFDGAAIVSADALATMLHRVWGAIGTYEIAPGATAVKKSSPAGGGLHGTEAYLLVQRAEGLAPGLYHYLPVQHALEPLRELDPTEAATLAHRFVAGQYWFANAPVLVVMATRFDRLFWKYRRHSKAWRVAHLDIGHLSQTMYLSAADLGLGAFVTAAINDREVDAELQLPPLREGSIAIVGFGPRAARRTIIELDDVQPTATTTALRAAAVRA